MKNLSLLVVGILLISGSLMAQTIRRVNNTEGVTGANVYTTIQAAHNASVNGDIILVEPSATSYGNLVCSKNLKIYGNGYFLTKNGIVLKANLLSSMLDRVDFVPGSNGSEIYGCVVDDFWLRAVSDITISRNHCGSFGLSANYQASLFINPPVVNDVYANVSGILFSQNYSTGSFEIKGYTYLSTDYKVSNTTISNNYLFKTVWIRELIDNCVFKNNTVFDNGLGGQIFLSNTIFENNIIIINDNETFDVVQPLTGNFTASNSSLNYNVHINNLPGTPGLFGAGIGTGNQNTQDNLATHLVVPTPDMSDDAKYQLKIDSPFKTASSTGGEVGMYGGPVPYLISGIPAVPSITNLKTTGTGSNTTPITVTFSAKSNN